MKENSCELSLYGFS
jgi:hypothetical protein